MFASKSVHSYHADLIHDVAYDYYGQRMATCSSDQMIKIWDLRDDQEWECTAKWRYHLGSVWRVCWAHPEFGQIIATCSFDRTIAIWEEITGQDAGTSGDSAATPAQTSGTGGVNSRQPSTVTAPTTGAGSLGVSSSAAAANTNPAGTSNTRGGVWIRRAHLVDPRNSVTGLMFAPRFLGLQLAAISTDGVMLVYEAQDVMNLCQWTVQCDYQTNMTGSCLAWSQSRLNPPLIAVGSASMCDSQHPGEVGELSHLSGQESEVTPNHGKLILLEYNENSRRWSLVQDIVDIKESVYDVAFAPSMGQSYQVLAVGSEGLLILLIQSVSAPQVAEGGVNTPGVYNVSVMARFENNGGRVSRVAWNFQGNILASAGDDGTVRLWCSNYLKAWFPMAIVRPGEVSLPIPPSFLSAAATINSIEQSHSFLRGSSAAQAASAATDNPRQQQQSSNTTEISSGNTTAPVTMSTISSEASIESALSADTSKPVRFKKSGSVVYSRNQVAWH
nr:nucleoporin seh1 A [Hymenolepis microstoma]